MLCFYRGCAGDDFSAQWLCQVSTGCLYITPHHKDTTRILQLGFCMYETKSNILLLLLLALVNNAEGYHQIRDLVLLLYTCRHRHCTLYFDASVAVRFWQKINLKKHPANFFFLQSWIKFAFVWTHYNELALWLCNMLTDHCAHKEQNLL